MRIACLLVPELPLAALLRSHPELEGQAFAVASASGPGAEIIAASSEARRQGVHLFQTVAQARSRCASLLVRRVSEAESRAAKQALLDAALGTSPRAELAPPTAGYFTAETAVFVDASGCRALFQSEAGFAGALVERSRRLGIPAVVAVAGSRSVAKLVARELVRIETGATRIVPAGGDSDALAPLPFELFDPDDELAERLTRFGLRRLGDLKKLPRRTAASRLGEGSRELLSLAYGETTETLPALSRESRFEESSDLEVPVDRLEALSFVLRGMLSRLIERLDCRHLTCGDLHLDLLLEGGGRDTRRVGVAGATSDVRVLLRLVTLSLETKPPEAPVDAVVLATEGRGHRSDQLDFFRPTGPAPRVLSRAVAELEALCGKGKVGSPGLVNSHRPDRYSLEEPEAKSRTALSPSQSAPVARALRPPLAVQVYAPHGSPEHLRSALANGHVLQCAGPWRTTGAWWSEEERFAFDHFDVSTQDGYVFRLRRDLLRGVWEIDAIYD